ncbi:MAG: dCTP deaminase [Candidatus Dojkabacteria bacterium]|nr:MAG: dCTP deaminase [Candidatus Dojkabacteria bacterium]
MILSDKTIRDRVKSGQLVLEPFNEDHLQPASYDLTLGNKFLIFDTPNNLVIDVKEDSSALMREVVVNDGDFFVLHPGEFALANIAEVTGVDDKHVGRLEGKSSLGRIGIIIHATAGFLDPGNKLRMTLEFSNIGTLPVKLYPGMKIAQMAFEELDQPCEKPYGHKSLNSKYYGDMDVQASKMHKNF